MIFSAPHALDVAAPRLPAALVSAGALARARAAAVALPDIVSSACLECRLEEGAERVDFIACVLAAEGGRRALSIIPASSPLRRSPAWSPVFQIFAAWCAQGSALAHQAPYLCLEVDLPAPATEVPAPLVLCCLQPAPGKPSHPGERRPAEPTSAAVSEPRFQVAKKLLSLLGTPLSPAAERTLAACFEALPPIGQVVHIGPLQSRGLDAVRLVGSMPGRDLPGYLRRIGWPGSLGRVGEVLEVLCPPEKTICFDLDVGETVLPILGIERHERGTAAPYAGALDWLCAQGACTLEKRAGVLAWPGREEALLQGHAWPTVAHRMVEIKVVLVPGGGLQAKAYLGLEHGFSFFGN